MASLLWAWEREFHQYFNRLYFTAFRIFQPGEDKAKMFLKLAYYSYFKSLLGTICRLKVGKFILFPFPIIY